MIPCIRHNQHTSHTGQDALWVTVALRVAILWILHSFTFFYGDGGYRLHTAPVIPIRVTSEDYLKKKLHVINFQLYPLGYFNLHASSWNYTPNAVAVKTGIMYLFPPIALMAIYSVILSVLDPRKCEYIKDYSLDFEHAYTTTYLAS